MLKSVGSGWLLTGVNIAATFVLLPFVLRTLGEDAYGIWLLMTAIIGYLDQLLLGVPMASVRYFAKHVAEGDVQQLNKAIATCTGLYLMMGLAALVLGAGLFAFFVVAYEIPPTWQWETRVAFALLLLHAAVSYVFMVPYGIMAAHHDFVIRNAVWLARTALRFVLTLVLVWLTHSLLILAVIQVATQVFEFIVLFALIRRRYPEIRIGLHGFDRRIVKQIFSFSVYVMFLTAGWKLGFGTDSLVIGAFLDVSQIPYYVVASRILAYLIDFSGSVAQPVMPMATKLRTEGRSDELLAMFLRWSKLAFSLTVLVGLFLLVLGPRFIAWWIDASYEEPSGRVLQIIMLCAMALLPITAVSMPILLGVGRPRTPTILFLITGAANLVLSIVLVGPLGLNGVAIATAIPYMLFAAVLVPFTCREVGASISVYARYVIVRVAIGAIPSLLILLWFRVVIDVRSFLGMTLAGLVLVLVYAFTSVVYVYQNDPYIDLRKQLARFAAGTF